MEPKWNSVTLYRFCCQQEGRVIEDKLCGPFWVPEALELISIAYTAFLGEHLLQWLDDLTLSLRFKVVFMHDNTPSHAAMAPTSFLKSQTLVEKPL